ncbi:MAG TPA: flavodoxin family protein [Desulfobacteraceae bacterium]|nr:flavodoxin family protein [Desulfobacteraceae bacterium]HPJ67290.1 flavodoxin family protein [Desulfobacteraceae bacterium]HPQ29273.1 flavodoxin family protein [Desulfobacteraceae bacterium]
MEAKTESKRKKVLVLTGSPRPNSNSTILAEQALNGAIAAGADVELFHLAMMKINPCTACDGCRKKNAKGCVIRDDMQLLYPRVMTANAIIIAGPVYWFNMSSYTKLFMDRLYAFGAGDYRALRKKRIGIILTYGDADPFVSGAVNALRSFQDSFSYVGASIAGMVYASAEKAGDIKRNTQAMEDARELGRTVV